MDERSLYGRLGGEIAIGAAVDRFYERVLADPDLHHFFSDTSMVRLKAHQAAFLSRALDGPKHYPGADMEFAHGRLTIERRHFDLVATHLVEALRELGVSEAVIGEVAEAVTPLASDIVNA